jgi:hypothetical protein
MLDNIYRIMQDKRLSKADTYNVQLLLRQLKDKGTLSDEMKALYDRIVNNG